MNDEELRSLLREWEAPPAPATLRKRVLPQRRSSWFEGRRLALSLALASSVVFIFSSLWILRHRTPGHPATLSDFEQVSEFQPRIVRSIP